MQGLRPENQINLRHPADNGLTFLAGHTATDTDAASRHGVFPLAPPAQLGKHLFLRAFTNRAGIEQQQISLVGVLGALIAMRGR